MTNRRRRSGESNAGASNGEAARFPIVGIGASAGGLAAFEAFFSGMPAGTDSGMAFVLVQHLAPDHESILTQLVKRYTRMEVFEVEDGMLVKVNCAYIIPPNRDMAFLNGKLQLLEPVAPRGHRSAIDFFFRSLAQDQRDRAICIVLSGTGTDGTLGLRAVKAEGGMAMAQNPESTEYDGMPRSAIATGLVDYTLPPAEMPAQLIAYASRAFRGSGVPRPVAPSKEVDGALSKIFVLLRAQTGHDFSQYKHNTIQRRIDRRMAVQQIEQLEDYVRYVQANPGEVEALFRDLLIGVTSFFRDTEAFDALRQHVATLLASKPAGSTIRAWVAGCSTGEEAYSIAILLREQIEATKQNFELQVFATDIDSHAVEGARRGVYPSSISREVSPGRLARYFSEDAGFYRINKSIRDALIFSQHDVIKDPPFSKLDLLSCRNLLIYLGADLQRKLVPLFHYALNSTGMLLLGSSESTSDFVDLFGVLDRKWKLYQRKEAAYGAVRPSLGKVSPSANEGAVSAGPAQKPLPQRELTLREVTERALLRRSPVAALVNEHGELLYLHGYTGNYLQPAPGEAGLNISKMAREGLRGELTEALARAALEDAPVYRPNLRVKTNGDFSTVNLTVEPVPAGMRGERSRSLLVVFEPVTSAMTPEVEGIADNAAEVESRVAKLTLQLRAKDEYLESIREECQTATEELKSSNEELQSTNEELQSTNEELETSKEELQSVNEELATVNAELQNKVSDLSRANNDMNNLLAGTGVGTIFVDLELRIQRYTPAVTQLINLIRTDAGRPLGHVVSNLVGYDRLVADVQEVLETLIAKEVEVKTHSGSWYLLRIRPYRTLENVIEGAVITFTDVTALKEAQAVALECEALRRMAAVVRDAYDAITVSDLDGRILAWNHGAARIYGWKEEEALTMNVRSLIAEGEQEEAVDVVRRLTRAEVLAPFRTRRITKDARVVEISLTATALVNYRGEVYAIATTERELTEAAHV